MLAALIAETRSCGGAFAARGFGTRCFSTATRKLLFCKPQATASFTMLPLTMATLTLCIVYFLKLLLTRHPTEGALRQHIACWGE